MHEITPEAVRGTNPPALSQSLAWTLLSRGPNHAWWEHPELGALSRKTTDAMIRGTVLHEQILGGSKVEIYDFPDWRTKEARTAKTASLRDGKTPILAKQIESYAPILASIRAILDERGMTPDLFVREQRLHWDYGGIRCMGTPDAYLLEAPNAIVWDLKTVERLENRATMSRKAAQSGWALQCEAYSTALTTLNPELRDVQWYWVIAEVEPPHQCVVVPPAPSMIELGRMQWERAVVLWRTLLESGWDKPWSEDWSAGLEAPSYELTRESEALDEMIGG